jgi:glucosamine--fructose-6-phosphate aminotransferase (isomerizing)
MSTASRMFSEAAEAADVVRRQIAANAAPLASLGVSLRNRAPRAVVTCARGSSDHAATFAKYLIETHARLITSSAAPSLSSVYDANTDLRDVLFIAISQSGKSPDLLAAAKHARECGALVVALLVGAGALAWARRGDNARLFPVWVGGLTTGLVAAMISAPIAAGVFGGVTGGGTDALVALFRTLGLSVFQSAFAQGLTSDPLDKTISYTIVFLILGALPITVRTMYSRGETTVAE